MSKLNNSVCVKESGKELFKRERDWHTQQTCLMIGILCMYGDVTVERPFKMKISSLSFVKASSFCYENKVVDLNGSTEKRIEQLREMNLKEGIKDTTLKRRMEIYKVIEHIHVLMDTLKISNVKIKTEIDSHSCLFDRRILHSIVVDGIDISKEEIIRKGNKIHSALVERLLLNKIQKHIVIPRYDTEVMSLLLN